MRVGVFGATGQVGGLVRRLLSERSFPVDDWVLLDLRPLSVSGARGMYVGTIHHRDGTLAALLAQETLLRVQPG